MERIRPRHLSTVLVASLLAVGLCASISSAATGNGSLTPGDHTFTLAVQGTTRSFILHVPPGAPVTRRPLLLIFHGSRASAQGTIGVTDFEQVANRTGQLVAFLQGVNDHWNEYSGTFGSGGVNDVTYTSDVIKDIEANVAFDHTRIVAAGFSNGALMVQSLGCQLARTLAMIVPVEGQITTSMVKMCAPARPLSVFEIHGTADASIAYGGGGYLSVLSAPGSVAKWASYDHCSKKATTTKPSHSVQTTTYPSCRGAAHVALMTIFGGVHRWTPGIGEIVTAAFPWSKPAG